MQSPSFERISIEEALLQATRDPDVVARFWTRVQKCEEERGCWIWVGGKSGKYGQFNHRTRCILAHRFSWHLANSEKCPDGMVIRHRCDNPPCVRPEHLEIGSQSENVRDCYKRNRRAHRTWPAGSMRPNAVLTDETVVDLRRAARSGQSIQSLADGLNLSYSSVLGAIRGTRWKHVPEPPVPGRRNRTPSRNKLMRNEPTLRAKAVDLMNQGFSIQRIASQLDISRTAAFRACRTQDQEVTR